MRRSWKIGCWTIALGMFCALAGCSSVPSSGIDPSGQYLFTPPPCPPNADNSNERYYDQPLGQVPWDDVCVQIQPREVVAPVGSEVVLSAGVCGPDGYLRTNRRLEWSLDPGGVGQFVAVGQNGLVDWLLGDFNRPRKISNTFAIGSTSRTSVRLNRGDCNPETNVYVLRGEGWISLTSNVEGVSRVTVFAPEVYQWKSRLQSAVIHWVDAQWQFPTPAIRPAGTKTTLSTRVMRATSPSPCVGWRVRYEIVGGPPAGFSPDGSTAIEAVTNAAGEAIVEIFQKDPCAGANPIAIQVIRPGELPEAAGKQLIVGSGTTMQTWTCSSPAAVTAGPAASSAPAAPAAASSIRVDVAGPSQAKVGDQVTFEITVSNLGASPAKNLTIRDRLDQGLEHPAANRQNAIERLLGDLAAGDVKRINVTVRAARPGQLCQTIEVGGPDAAQASKQICLTVVGDAPATAPETPAAPKSSLELKVTCPTQQLTVGETARFTIELVNRGAAPLRNVQILNRYDAALVPAMATDGYRLETGGLAWTIDYLPPGKAVQLGVHSTCQSPAARACNRVSATASGDIKAEAEACVEVRPAEAAAPAAPPADKPPETPAAAAADGLTMSVVGLRNPVIAGKELTYEILVTNKGATSYQQVSVAATVPEGMFLSPLGTVGPGPTKFAVEGRTVRYEPVFEIRPGESLMYRVRVQTQQTGQFRFRAQLSAPALPQPLVQEAATEVF